MPTHLLSATAHSVTLHTELTALLFCVYSLVSASSAHWLSSPLHLFAARPSHAALRRRCPLYHFMLLAPGVDIHAAASVCRTTQSFSFFPWRQWENEHKLRRLDWPC